MTELIDFTENQIHERRFYAGANGKKIAIYHHDDVYMLKFPARSKSHANTLTDNHSVISEYLSCKIIQSMGLPVQEVLLGQYKGTQVVACKDFVPEGYRLFEFLSVQNSDLNEPYAPKHDLHSALGTIDRKSPKMGLDKKAVISFFWQQFVVDSLLGNFDRHHGNWGFLVDEKNAKASLAPIYDCGSCLLPEADEAIMDSVLSMPEKLAERVYVFPLSALTENHQKINPFDFLMKTDNLDLLEALLEVAKRIDKKAISRIIDQTPTLTSLQKAFYQTYIEARYELIICHAIEHNPFICRKTPS